jgi:predicted MFS family arabinose efflux permease
MPRIDRRTFVIFALLALIAGNLASALTSNWLSLFAFRVVCGLSGGGVITVVYATAALRSAKDSTFAIINMGNLLWGMLLVSTLPLLLKLAGVSGVFVLMATVSALALIGSKRIPRHCPEAQNSVGQAKSVGPAAFLLLLLFGLLFFGHSALWVYQERIGKSIGLEPQQIGGILGASILAGAIGAALAGIIGRRLGLLFPQLLGFGGAVLATLVMVHGTTILEFTVTAGLIHFVWFFSLPYLLSIAAELDPSGRVAGLASAAIFVGQGLGPFAAALVIDEGNYRAVGWLAACAYIVALIISCIVVALLRQHSLVSNNVLPDQPRRLT